jgi:glutamine cyclotransferase
MSAWAPGRKPPRAVSFALSLLLFARLAGAELAFEVVGELPHDPDAFTQGLLFHDGYFFESTGLYRRSSLRQVEPETGRILRERRLPDDLFGEGLTLSRGRLVQLTWKSHRGFEYDLDTFEPIREFGYPTEGWGITSTATHLIMSDGSARLFFLDPHSFAAVGDVLVRDDHGPVTGLNELEYARGRIFANVFESARIVAIDPESGEVTSTVDLGRLVDRQKLRQSTPVGVLNGIAYDAARDLFFLTGKNWANAYEVRFFGDI